MQPDNWRTWLSLGLAFILASFLVYFPALNLPLLADDYLFCHPLLLHQQLSAWGSSSLGGKGVFFRPLVILSYYMDVSLWPLNSLGYHAVNLTLHGLNAFLVVRLAYLWQQWFPFSSKPFGTALLSGILFLVLPSHTETVAWVSGRTDLLSTCFGLLALFFGSLFLSNGRYRTLAFSLAAVSAALFSKENALVLTPVLLITGLIGLKSAAVPPIRVRQVTRLAGWWALFSAAYLIARFSVLRQWIGGYGPKMHLSLTWDSLFNLGVQIPRMLLPALPPAWMAFVSPEWAITVFWITLAAAVLSISRQVKLQPSVWLWPAGLAASMLCALLPTLNMSVRFFVIEGERLLYLPSVFACMLLIRLVRPFTRSWRTVVAMGLLGLSFVGLQWNNSRWVQAGRLFKTLLAEVSVQTTRPRLLILNLPAAYGGAHMFITGFDIALRMHALVKKDLAAFQRINQLQEIRVFSLHDVFSTDDALRMDFTRRSADMALLAPGACFRLLPRERTSEGIAIVRQDFLAISFAYPNGLPEDAVVLYYDRGHLQPLEALP
ncbi:MAG: hypothetical protein AB1439_12420 [candidate division FCPU426 bacterium]